jgi:hypothetical protein
MARLLFHSPSVRPDPQAPTGPALAAHLLLEALRISRHAVEPAARFLLHERPDDDAARRRRIAAAAAGQAARVRRFAGRRPPGEAPQAWLCFRPVAAAPDRVGGAVAGTLGLPAILVAAGPEDAAAAAGPAPAAVVAVGQDALDAVAAARPPGGPAPVGIRPFVDLAAVHAMAKTRATTRSALAARLQLPSDEPWLAAVLADGGGGGESLSALCRALSRVAGLAWKLVLVQAGAATGEAARTLSGLPRERVRLVGPVDRPELMRILSAADLFAWPRVGEAEALALLQAQAFGLPAVTGRTPAAADIVVDGRTGRLAEAGNPASFANQLTFLLRHPEFLATYRKAAAETALADHGLATAADALDAAIEGALG